MTKKCETCLNSRPILSENGWHYVCCLSIKQEWQCFSGEKDHYVGLKRREDDMDLEE